MAGLHKFRKRNGRNSQIMIRNLKNAIIRNKEKSHLNNEHQRNN